MPEKRWIGWPVQPLQNARWAEKPINVKAAQDLEVFDTPSNALMGSGNSSTFGWIIGNTLVMQTNGVQIKGLGSRNFQQWGLEGAPLEMPRTIRFTNGAGWYAGEMYPMSIVMYDYGTGETSEVDASEFESLNLYGGYLPYTPVGGVEPAIDYGLELLAALTTFCKANRIILAVGAQDYNPENFTSTNHRQPSQYPWDTSRWMYNLVPRWNRKENGFWGQGNFFNYSVGGVGNTTFQYIDPALVKGGMTYNIVIATDGLGMYHGATYNGTIYDAPVTNYYAQDLDFYRSIAPNYYKIGGVVVNSPKNAEWFPMWSHINLPNNTNEGRAWAYADAVLHFQQAVADLGENWSLLQRTIGWGTPPSNTKHEEVDDSRGHMIFTKPQVTIGQIMDKVKAFFEV